MPVHLLWLWLWIRDPSCQTKYLQLATTWELLADRVGQSLLAMIGRPIYHMSPTVQYRLQIKPRSCLECESNRNQQNLCLKATCGSDSVHIICC
jgi:hypothetical protein